MSLGAVGKKHFRYIVRLSVNVGQLRIKDKMMYNK